MEDEFSTLPVWTADAVELLGPEHAVPAGCRGSGTPEALRWMCRTMGLAAGHRLLDSGAGEGGPAELAAREFGVAPVLVDPMPGACVAAHRMFHRPVAVSGGEQLPFGDGTFDAAWSLGVLCTVADKVALLTELRRVVRQGGPLGLLVYVRTVAVLPEQPDGNAFPDREELEAAVHAASLRILAQAPLADFAEAAPGWRAKAEAVDRVIDRDHRGDDRLVAAQEQQRSIGRLLADGLVQVWLLVVRAA
jgi:ubiquinone/menaquinone biosynthesis C-methylase UbiE